MRSLGDEGEQRLLAARLEGLSAKDVGRWGRMTAAGMVCHLSDSFRFALGEATASEASGLLQRTIMKWGALYLPVKWPANVPTRPEIEQGVGGTTPGEFGDDRVRLLEWMTRFCAPASVLAERHPIFGRVTRAQWMRWGYLHMDHHLRQFGR